MDEPEPKVADTEFVRIELYASGFARSVTKPVPHTGEHAQFIIDLIRDHRAEIGHRIKMLVDMRRVPFISREARVLYGSDEHAQNMLGTALLIDSGISRVIGNFMMGLSKRTLAPIQLFTDEHEAIEWLDSLQGQS